MRNAIASGEFVANLATWELREAVNLTSTPARPASTSSSSQG